MEAALLGGGGAQQVTQGLIQGKPADDADAFFTQSKDAAGAPALSAQPALIQQGLIQGKIRLLRPRQEKNRVHSKPQDASVQCDNVAFAFSGGGIRSAAQCAGVLKAAANDHQSIKTVSCVSGGGYLGSALIDHQAHQIDQKNRQSTFEWDKFFEHFRSNHGCVLD